jgi:hypothetical protein
MYILASGIFGRLENRFKHEPLPPSHFGKKFVSFIKYTPIIVVNK